MVCMECDLKNQINTEELDSADAYQESLDLEDEYEDEDEDE